MSIYFQAFPSCGSGAPLFGQGALFHFHLVRWQALLALLSPTLYTDFCLYACLGVLYRARGYRGIRVHQLRSLTEEQYCPCH